MTKGDVILAFLFNRAKYVGWYGEHLIENVLEKANHKGMEGSILRNIYVPKPNGETTEIDVLYITKKGVFVIESKNYSGWIYGKDTDPSWCAVLPGRKGKSEKHSFYNPIMQNKGHILWLSRIIGRVPIYSIIVFSERCQLKKVKVDKSSGVFVVKRNRLLKAVKTIWRAVPDALTPDQLADIVGRLEAFSGVDNGVQKAHIANIRSHMKGVPHTVNKVKEVLCDQEQNSPIMEQGQVCICPRCGANLVIREVKKGVNAGSVFLGCSNFPRCRYTQSL